MLLLRTLIGTNSPHLPAKTNYNLETWHQAPNPIGWFPLPVYSKCWISEHCNLMIDEDAIPLNIFWVCHSHITSDQKYLRRPSDHVWPNLLSNSAPKSLLDKSVSFLLSCYTFGHNVKLPRVSYSSSVHQLSNTKLLNYSGLGVVVKYQM